MTPETVLVRTVDGLFFNGPPLDLIMRTLIGASSNWQPSGRPFWTLDTKPTRPERYEVYVQQSEQGNFWDWGHLGPLFEEAVAKRGGLIIDVGANIGTSAIWAGSRGTPVVAVEAYGPTYELLCRNVAANQLEGFVYPLRWVAEEREGKFTARKEPASLGYESEIMLGGVEFEPAKLDGLDGGPLDKLIPMYTLGKRVTLIKTDVQGCDLAALKGLRRTILEHKPVIVFEYEVELAEARGESFADYESFIAELNYSLQEISMNNWVARPRP